MKVRNKIAITVIPIFIMAIILLNLSFGLFFQNYVKKQEAEQIDTLTNSLSSFFYKNQSDYLGSVNDWGHWDETYNFIIDEDPGYFDRNINEDTFINLDLNLIIMTDYSGQIVFKQFYTSDQSLTDFPAGFYDNFQDTLDKINSNDDFYAILNIGGAFFFIAASDVTDSLLELPRAGKLIIGRQLTGDIIETIEKITGCSVDRIYLDHDLDISAIAHDNSSAVLYQSDISSDQDMLYLEFVIPNINDLTASPTLHMTMPRTAFINEMKDVTLFSILNTTLFAIVSLLILLLIGRFLSKPFSQLIGDVRRIDISASHLDKLSETGREEFRFLRQTINRLLSKIETYHAELVESKEILRATLVSIGDGMISVDTEGRITFLNPIAEKLTGWSLEEALNQPIEIVFNIVNEYTRAAIVSPVQVVLERNEIVELANHTLLVAKDGTERPIEDTAAPIKDVSGITRGCVLVFRDFTERKEKQRWIEFLSLHDQLTGLYNRRFFEEELHRLNINQTLPLSFIYADVNGLKIINDAFGHASGDLIIKWVAELLASECPPNGFVSRIGGDEFVILLPSRDKVAVAALVEHLTVKANSMKFKDIEISISFGWDTKDDLQQTALDVLKNAEDQMYQKKIRSNTSKRNSIISTILQALHHKCPREAEHSKRVRDICESIGIAFQLSPDDIWELTIAGELHDIGKIAIDEFILNKVAPLTDAEWAQIRHHPDTGYRLLSATNEFSSVAEHVLSHHERWDGTGYPRGHKAEEINWKSRVISVADAYDAITCDRPYRKALSPDTAAQIIRSGAGTQFDPEIARVFVESVLGLDW